MISNNKGHKHLSAHVLVMDKSKQIYSLFFFEKKKNKKQKKKTLHLTTNWKNTFFDNAYNFKPIVDNQTYELLKL
jgi:hypothetical protein